MSSKKNKNKGRPAVKVPDHSKNLAALKAEVAKNYDNELPRHDGIPYLSDNFSSLVDGLPTDMPRNAGETQKAAVPEGGADNVSEYVPENIAENISENIAENGQDSPDIEQDTVKEFIPRSSKQKPASLSTNLTEALGDSDELDETDGEAASAEGEEAAPQRPNKLYLIFAIFVIIMSVVGVVSTVRFCIDTVSDIANQTELKNELAVFLYPVVSVDPPDCETVEELPATIILESAIWRIILRGDNSNYERLSNTYMYVPAVDVEFSVRAIYGNSAKIEHQTVGSIDTTFTYMKDLNSYVVPVNPFYTAYSPYITEISSVGELYTVTVDYIIPSALNIEGIEYENPPAKTMQYTLSKRTNGMTLHSIKNITTKEHMYD